MLVRVLDRLEETIVATLIAAATLLVFAAVVQRYGLSHAAQLLAWAKANGHEWVAAFAKSLFLTLNSVRLTWAQELCIFMFIWMAKFGAAYGVRTGIHVGVDILVNALPEAQKRLLILFGLVAGALFTAIIAVLGARLCWHLSDLGQTSAVLELPMWIVYLAIPLGSSLMCFRFLEVAWRFWSTGQLPKHEHGHIDGLEPVRLESAR